MGALRTGTHTIRVPYGPGPILATITYIGGVSFTTYQPPRNHWGDASHNQRVQPPSGKEAQHSTDQRHPALEWPKGTACLYTVRVASKLTQKLRILSHHPLDCSQKWDTDSMRLTPRGRGDMSWFVPEP